MATLSSADDSSLEALEALLTFRNGITSWSSPRVHPEIPVPNPLNPLLPHVIEGESTPRNHTKRFLTRAQQSIVLNHMNPPSHASSVPNPLELLAASSSSAQPSASAAPCHNGDCSNMLSYHNPDRSPYSDDATKPPGTGTSDASVRTDKIQDALNSRPQRGKKRRNLNEQERLELTRTRNREHAKCTRMKKKARHMELLEMEQMYLVLKAKQELNSSRRSRLIEIIASASGTQCEQVTKACPQASRLRSLASEKLRHAQISLVGNSPHEEVALSANSATVKVLVSGTDHASGESKSITAFCVVDFDATSSKTTSISLHLVTPEGRQGKMFPSVSTLSFETSQASMM